MSTLQEKVASRFTTIDRAIICLIVCLLMYKKLENYIIDKRFQNIMLSISLADRSNRCL